MKETEVKLGQLVLSTQGRDKGVLAIVVEKVDDKFVKIADGTVRRVSKPKLKKIKHLKITEDFSIEVIEKIEKGQPLTDGIVAKAIKSFQELEGENV